MTQSLPRSPETLVSVKQDSKPLTHTKDLLVRGPLYQLGVYDFPLCSRKNKTIYREN